MGFHIHVIPTLSIVILEVTDGFHLHRHVQPIHFKCLRITLTAVPSRRFASAYIAVSQHPHFLTKYCQPISCNRITKFNIIIMNRNVPSNNLYKLSLVSNRSNTFSSRFARKQINSCRPGGQSYV